MEVEPRSRAMRRYRHRQLPMPVQSGPGALVLRQLHGYRPAARHVATHRKCRRHGGLAVEAARTLIVALLFWSGSAVAEATTGIEFEARCTVKVEGKTYLQNRKCRVDFWPNIAGPLTSGEAANGI